MAVFYIADTHFGHANIIKLDRRPFNSVEEMDYDMVKRWNSVVKPGDMVYILGDFCWKKEADWLPLLKSLNGNKTLVRGNHDLKHINGRLRKAFADVKDYKEIKDGTYRVLMSHYPMLFYKRGYDKKTIMLCGHVHTTKENDWLNMFRTEMRANRSEDGDSYARIINVGAMMPYMDYTPRTLDEILKGSGL